MALKEWAKLHYKEPEKSKLEIKTKLDVFHSSIDIQGLNQETYNHEKNLYRQLYRINRKEEDKW